VIVDIIAALRSTLLADAAVTTLVGIRVFGNELEKAEAGDQPRKTIAIQPSGGGVFSTGARDFIRHSDTRFDVFCYGETPFEAGRVRREVHDVLKQINRLIIGGVLIHWVNPAGGFLATRDPDTQWPTAFESFQVFFSEQAVP